MKLNLFEYLHIYRILAVQDIKAKMHFRLDFFVSLIGVILTNVAGAVSIWIMFHQVNTIKGYNYNEILFLYGFSILALAPSAIFFDNVWNISRTVHSGDFIKYCFRPLNIMFYYMSETFNFIALTDVIFGLTVIIYAVIQLQMKITLIKIVIFIFALVSASLIMCGIFVLASSTAFWIYNCHSILIFVNKFKDYTRYPITIFGSALRFILSFIIPIAYVSYYPSLLLIRSNSINVLSLLTPVFGVVFFTISCRVWIHGAYQYNGTGS